MSDEETEKKSEQASRRRDSEARREAVCVAENAGFRFLGWKSHSNVAGGILRDAAGFENARIRGKHLFIL